MDIAWYLIVASMVFCIGAVGVLVRRNPLVVLICIELMLNAGTWRSSPSRACGATATARSSPSS